MQAQQDHQRPVVSVIFRKKNPLFFSIEKVFSSVIKAMPRGVEIKMTDVPNYSSSLRDVWANIRAVRKIRATVYHVTGDIHYVVLGLPWHKTMLTIHDCVFLQQATGMKRRILKMIWLTWPVRAAAIVTTISETSREEIVRHTGVRPGKIVVIPNPIGDHLYYRAKEFDEDRPVILFIGSTPNKNLDRIIEALQDIGCRLDIIGKISRQQQERLAQLNISYTMAHQISEEELAEKYVACDMVLFPSTYEGFGLPIVEAQKAGRPVITSNLNPMKEVAGGAACLVDPLSVESIRQAVLRVKQDQAYREQLVEKGFQNIRRYDASAIAALYLACYRRIAGKNQTLCVE